MKVEFKKLNKNAVEPTYSSKCAAGADLYSINEEPITIKSGDTKMIETGIAVAIPEGYVGLIYARSGLASKHGIAPANKVGVIDSDYRGEILVPLYNQSGESFTINGKERVAQMIITPYEAVEYTEVRKLDETERGDGGFGSTGKK